MFNRIRGNHTMERLVYRPAEAHAALGIRNTKFWVLVKAGLLETRKIGVSRSARPHRLSLRLHRSSTRLKRVAACSSTSASPMENRIVADIVRPGDFSGPVRRRRASAGPRCCWWAVSFEFRTIFTSRALARLAPDFCSKNAQQRPRPGSGAKFVSFAPSRLQRWI